MPRPKKVKGKKDHVVKFRLSSKAKRRAQMFAKVLASGNLSEFCRHAIENFDAKFLKGRK
jgi:hypothetical protein